MIISGRLPVIQNTLKHVGEGLDVPQPNDFSESNFDDQ